MSLTKAKLAMYSALTLLILLSFTLSTRWVSKAEVNTPLEEVKVLSLLDSNSVKPRYNYISSNTTLMSLDSLTFHSLAHPVRLLETRSGLSGCYTTSAPLAANSTRTQVARGTCDGLTIPANAKAVVGNATVVFPVNPGSTPYGYLTFWPSDTTQPTVASANYPANSIVNTPFTVGLGASDGAFKIFTTLQTELVIDLVGYYSSEDPNVIDIAGYGCIGDGATNNPTDNATCLSSAYSAAVAANLPLYIPAGNFKTTTFPTISANNFVILGAGRKKSIISSASNATILSITGGGSHLSNFTVKGNSTGANQVGIKYANDTANHLLDSVSIENTGGSGVVTGTIFTSKIVNVETDLTGSPAIDITSGGPNVMLENCYVHQIPVNGVAYRFRKGSPLVLNCNGIDGSPSGSKWGIVGQRTSFTDPITNLPDPENSGAFPTFINCNFESWTAVGLEFRFGSTCNAFNCSFQGGGSSGMKAALFDMDGGNGNFFFPEYVNAGIWDESTTVGDGGDSTRYANGNPIHGSNIPPIRTRGRAGNVAGSPGYAGIENYYDSSLSRVEPLRVEGRYPTTTVTGSYTIQRVGVRLVEVNHSAAATVTLNWGGWYKPGEVVIVKDKCGCASTFNITVNASSGSTINGASSKVINTNYGSLVFYSDGLHWFTY